MCCAWMKSNYTEACYSCESSYLFLLLSLIGGDVNDECLRAEWEREITSWSSSAFSFFLKKRASISNQSSSEMMSRSHSRDSMTTEMLNATFFLESISILDEQQLLKKPAGAHLKPTSSLQRKSLLGNHGNHSRVRQSAQSHSIDLWPRRRRLHR